MVCKNVFVLSEKEVCVYGLKETVSTWIGKKGM